MFFFHTQVKEAIVIVQIMLVREEILEKKGLSLQNKFLRCLLRQIITHRLLIMRPIQNRNHRHHIVQTRRNRTATHLHTTTTLLYVLFPCQGQTQILVVHQIKDLAFVLKVVPMNRVSEFFLSPIKI